MRCRARLVIAVAASFLCAGLLRAQDRQVVIRYYHGLVGQSRMITMDYGDGEGEKPTSVERLSVSLPEGTEIVVKVMNANPVFYGYGLDAVEKKAEAAADLSSLISFLKGLPGLEPKGESGKRAKAFSAEGLSAAVAADDWLDQYVATLALLKTEITEAARLAASSDDAEPIAEVGARSSRGFLGACRAIGELSSEKLHFDSPTLRADFDEVHRQYSAKSDGVVQQADAEVKKVQAELDGKGLTDAVRAVVQKRLDAAKVKVGILKANEYALQGLRSQADLLIKARDALREKFDQTRSVVRTIAKVPKNGATMKLRVEVKDASEKRLRDTGVVLVIDVLPEYARSPIEFVPFTFAMYHPDIQRYFVREGIVARDTIGDWKFGPGTMFRWNFLNWGDRKEWGLATGLGFGLAAESGTVASHFCIAFMMNFKDLSIGIGGGAGWIPQRLKGPAVEGALLPADAGPLDDLVETRPKSALYIVFSIPGISVPIKP